MSFGNNLKVMDEQELNHLNVTFQLLSFRNILLRGKLMQVANFSYSLLIFGYRHHFSRSSKCSLILPHLAQIMENQELALDTVFCLCLQITGNTCLWDKQRSLVSKAVNLEANPLAKTIGNSISTICS